MSGPEVSAFGPAARDGDEPVFAEMWHAQVLALAAALSRAGLFSPHDWSATLGAELHGAPDRHGAYYEAALAALERLAGAGVTPAELSARTEAWRRAYLNTPHGQPVDLSAGV